VPDAGHTSVQGLPGDVGREHDPAGWHGFFAFFFSVLAGPDCAFSERLDCLDRVPIALFEVDFSSLDSLGS